MPIFQNRSHQTHYELMEHSVPHDTLLIHGNLASNRWWYPTVQALRDSQGPGQVTGSLCMAEWLGCGQSSPPRTLEDLRMPALARQYVDLVRELGLQNVNIVGHSTGGPIALYAVLEAPELFSKVILLDAVGPQGVQIAPEMIEAFVGMKSNRDFCAMVMAATIHEVDPQSEQFQAIVDDTFNRVDDKVWTGIPTVLSELDARADWARIEQPVLILQGEHDVIIEAAQAQALKATLRNSELRILAGQGHSCNVENPARFVQIMREFF